MCSQIDYISESPGTLGETQIPKYQPGLTESESPFFPYSSPEEAVRTGILIVPTPSHSDETTDETPLDYSSTGHLKHSSVHSQRRAVISTLLSVG